MATKKKASKEEEKQTRIAIVDEAKCKPKKCAQECKKNCPVVRTGKQCIEVKPTDKIAYISEELCIGCNICIKKCPFSAIQIINLPKVSPQPRSGALFGLSSAPLPSTAHEL